MKYQRLLAVVLGVCVGSASFGQRPDSSQTQKPSDGDVVRITTNLVQVDAVITDKNGKLITDLKPEELQLLEDNRAQKITHFSYIGAGTTNVPQPSTPTARDNKMPDVPRGPLRPEDVRRTVALVVDDLGLSFQSTHFMRRALKQFVDQQMQAGDLVAIIRTSGGIGALQQFTSDRPQLYAAIDNIKWYPGGGTEVGAFAPIGPATPFRLGETMRYSFVIYNPHVDPTTGQPQLQTQMRIFRDGQPVFTGRVQRFSLNNPPDITRLSAASAIKLGGEMSPGEYVLQVIVTDLLAGDKYATTSRWVDFKIVP